MYFLYIIKIMIIIIMVIRAMITILIIAIIIQRPTARPHLDGFDQVGGAVGHLLGRLDKVPLGRRVGCLGGSQTAGVAQRRRVLGDNGCGGENL